MQILICGAGQVGYNIAQQLAKEDNEITLIDQDPALIQRINDNLDVRAFQGHASHPSVLKKAGAEDADMLIAVTYSDEVNMVACQIAYSLFNIPTRIARIRDQDYLHDNWQNLYAHDHLALNVIISPEIEVARAIERRLHAPGTLDVIPFADDMLKVVAIRCLHDCPLNNLPFNIIKQKTDHLNMQMIGVMHDGKFILPTANTVLHEQDDVYFIATAADVRKSMALFGHHETEARRAIILGGGNVGLFLAQTLEQDTQHDTRVKVIEYNRERAEHISTKLHQTTVLQGSALDREILMEANIDLAEAVIAVTNDDETNILASLLAKRFGCSRTITLVNNHSYSPLLGDLGIDVVVSPRDTTVSRILQHVRRGKISSVHTVGDGTAEIIEAEIMETSALVGKSIQDAGLPKGIYICALIRADGTIVLPKEDAVMHEHDKVIVLATANLVRKVEKIFSVSVEYF